ncbi:MAG: hypothetical protein SGPRY_002036 [Prymnesium sp.]
MLIAYDQVLSRTACHFLHTSLSIGGLGDEHHTAFDRSLPARTPAERAIHSLLCELGDESPCVEYWWRDEWQHIEAHTDIDEFLFEEEGIWRFPTNAHVLYLAVGKAVRGPTCVWERQPCSQGRDDFGPITTVPARAGRLLRFEGNRMHAVPRPAEAWLEESTNTAGPQSDAPVDMVRSVILFNTWPSPPRDVKAAPSSDPIEKIKQLAADFGGKAIEDLVEAMSDPHDTCLPFEQWQPLAPKRIPEKGASSSSTRATEADEVRYSVPLLGEQERRQQEEQQVDLVAPQGLKEALTSTDVITSFV